MKFTKIYGPITSIGFITLSAQLLWMRELTALFYGNEIAIGTLLGLWLLWTAAGSGLIHRLLTDRDPRKWLIGFLWLWGLVLPGTLLLIRVFFQMSGLTAGEMVGYGPMLSISAVLLAPFCLISGSLYTLACRLLAKEDPSEAVRTVYLFEAVGAGLGGLFMNFIGMKSLSPMSIILVLMALNLISIGFLRDTKKGLHLFAAIIALIIGVGCADTAQRKLDQLSRPGETVIAARMTPHGHLILTQNETQINVYQNGLWLYSHPDHYSAETAVHYALLQHRAPKNILLIGGNLYGLAPEIFKHPEVNRLDYVTGDPYALKCMQQFLRDTLKTDPRIQIHISDSRHYLKQCGLKYDVILLTASNPYTNQLNRFYTVEFYRHVRQSLQPDGIFSFQIQAAENNITPELQDFLGTTYHTLSQTFSNITIYPGETQHWFASATGGQLTDNPNTLIDALRARNIQTLYVAAHYIPSLLSADRLAILDAFQTVSSPKTNTDLKPLGFLYDAILWATHFSSGFKTLYQQCMTMHPRLLFLMILMSVGLFLLFRNRLKPSVPVYLSLIGIGFTEMSLEIILIFGFQIFYGGLYQHLSLLIAAYMLGLTTGSYVNKKTETLSVNLNRYRKIQAVMAFFCLSILFLMRGLQFWTPVWMLPTLFAMLIAFAGCLGGYQFVLANRILRTEKNVGRLYALDLIGSALGALLTSLFLMPIYGLPVCLLLLFTLNGSIWVLLKMK